MTVTVVRGFISASSANETKASAKAAQAPVTPSAQLRVASLASSVTAGLNEASVATVRLAKSVTAGDKIRDEREARSLSNSLSERILEREDSADAHSELTPVSAREHFA